MPLVQLHTYSVTLAYVLDDIARQTGDMVWVVFERTDANGVTSCGFECFYGEHRFATGWTVPLQRRE